MILILTLAICNEIYICLRRMGGMGFKFGTEPRFRVGSPYQSLAIRAFRKWAIDLKFLVKLSNITIYAMN